MKLIHMNYFKSTNLEISETFMTSYLLFKGFECIEKSLKIEIILFFIFQKGGNLKGTMKYLNEEEEFFSIKGKWIYLEEEEENKKYIKMNWKFKWKNKLWKYEGRIEVDVNNKIKNETILEGNINEEEEYLFFLEIQI